MADEKKCPQDCECPKHDYASRVREKPDTLEAAVEALYARNPDAREYNAIDTWKALEKLGWDFPVMTHQLVFEAMLVVAKKERG